MFSPSYSKAMSMLKDPDDIIWILNHLDDILENAGLSSMLRKDYP